MNQRLKCKLLSALALLFLTTIDAGAETIYGSTSWLSSSPFSDDLGPCVGDIGDLGPFWTQPEFDDDGWSPAISPIPGSYMPPGVLNSQLMWASDYPLQGLFRYTLHLGYLPNFAGVRLWADDNFEFYLNGFLVDHDRSDGAGDHPWGSQFAVHEVDVTNLLVRGNNVFAIRGWDGSYCNVLPRGGKVVFVEINYEGPPAITCSGFEPPLASGPVKVKGNRALPFKAQLFDADGFMVTGADIAAPPVLQVWYEFGTPDAELVEIDALPAGQGDEGNQFAFTDDDKWQLNLKTGNYSAPGTYTVFMESGDEAEYRLEEPTCAAEFVVR